MIKQITSLSEFMTWVEESTNEIQESHISFFRGHEDDSYELMPSVYRVKDNKSYRKVEYQLYQNMLNRNPNAFAEDKTIFDRLVRMQHHGLPTRLLDITQSPLVALFFACQKPNELKNGEVMFFPKKQSEITFPSSIQEITLAYLDVVENYLSELINEITSELEYLYQGLDILTNPEDPNNKNDCNFILQQKTEIRAMKESSDLPQIFAHIRNIEKETVSQFHQRDFPWPVSKNKSKFEKEYDEVIKRIIGNQCERMRTNFNSNWYSIHSFLCEFSKFYFVYPPLNNERIRRQQGAFIIFPSVQTVESPLNYFKVTVEGSKKKNILTELEKLGFTRSYLFPELENQAKDICLRYPPQ